jgi:hypothetical protein
MQDSRLPADAPPAECYCPGPLVVSRGEHLGSCDRRRRRRLSREEAAERDSQITESFEDSVRFDVIRRRNGL